MLTDRIVMDSRGGAKGVGTLGDRLIEMPSGPVARAFDDLPTCALDKCGRDLDGHVAPGAELAVA